VQRTYLCRPGTREEALLKGWAYAGPAQARSGLAIEPTLRDVYISRFGQDPGTQDFVFRQVQPGDPISLRLNGWGTATTSCTPAAVYLGQYPTSCWCPERAFPGNRTIGGVEVTGLYRRSVEADRGPATTIGCATGQRKRLLLYCRIGGLARLPITPHQERSWILTRQVIACLQEARTSHRDAR